MNRNIGYLVVDIRDTIKEYNSISQFQSIYRYFPLADIISTVLTIESDLDYEPFIFDELERRLGDKLDHINMDNLTIFFETMVLDIDQTIQDKLPVHIRGTDFIFDKWISSTTLILRRTKY